MLYEVYRSTSTGFPLNAAHLIATVTGPPVVDTPLAPGTYYYRIVARDDAGNTSPPTPEFILVVGTDTGAPSVPAGLVVQDVTDTSVSLYWDDSADPYGVKGYNVFRDGVDITNAADNGFTDTGLSPSTAYTYTVSAYDAAGNTSAQSASVAATTAATPPPPPPGNTPWLPFNMPARSVLVDNSKIAKQVRVHYMGGVFPRSVDDKNAATDSTEYIRREWMPPGTVEGTVDHGVYGGLIRARKDIRAPLGSGFTVKDMMYEVRQMIECGVNGVWWDLLQVPQSSTDNPQRWKQFKDFLQAVDNVAAADKINLDGFVGIMPDGSTSGTKNATTLANAIKSVAGRRIFKPGGRLLYCPYQPETAPNYANTSTPGDADCIAFWQSVTTQLKSAGLNPITWLCFSRKWTTYAPAFNAAMNGGVKMVNGGMSRWGDRDPVGSLSVNNMNATAAQYALSQFNQKWMAPVSTGDDRPRGGAFWERRGTEQLRASWLAAMGLNKSLSKVYREADMVQIPTWDDYAEGAEIQPNKYNGGVWADVNAYYMCRYKTGVWPTIVRDCIYLTHRIHPLTGTRYTSRQTKFAVRRGSTPETNEIEALVFVTSPSGTVTITAGGISQNFDVATATKVAPNVYSFRVPLRTGTVSAKYVRNGTTVAAVTSPHSVSTTQLVQDTTYRGASSLRLA